MIPAWLCDKMIGWLKQHEAYDTTIRYVSGLVLFPFFWWLQVKLIRYFLSDFIATNFPVGLSYILTVIPTGLAAWWFYKKWQQYLAYLTFKKTDKAGELRYFRQQIVNTLKLLAN
jgi:hypothetical protein